MSGKRKGPKPPASLGDLSSEDQRLWRHVVRDAEPLTGRDKLRSKLDDLREQAAAQPAGQPSVQPIEGRRDKAAGGSPDGAHARSTSAPARPAPAARKPAAPLVHGARDGLDRAKAERLRRGKLPIEATLDLHGLRQAEAHRRLGRFLADCQDAGKRCVIVVTGKGLYKEEGGVLRSAVPRWLNEPGNCERVLSFDYAQPKHGGTGALYILLRRRR